MPVVGIDDTDSRERGMCTTYVAVRVGERLEDAGFAVQRHLLVRCNPAVEHKTRGNAALALHVADDFKESEEGSEASDQRAERCFEIAREIVDELAATDGGDANPGLVVADSSPEDISEDVASLAERAVRTHCSIDEAVGLADRHEFHHAGWGTGRGRIGALAAVGAWAGGASVTGGADPGRIGALAQESADDYAEIEADWTCERIAYRETDRWGTKREVDVDSVFDAAERAYPTVWDTVDEASNTAVCVPRTPCPVLYGIRGDDPDVVEAVAGAIESETVDRAVTFYTNQGTDAHLMDGSLGLLEDDHAYRVDGVVGSDPESREGGHVFFEIESPADSRPGVEPLPCVAFEPTKQFRDRVRNLRSGDVLTVCGEVADGTLKLEKFAVRDLVRTEQTTPICPDCGRTMESAGADQGYRCRDCDTSAPGPVQRPIDRDLKLGWYEVPPIARRHVAKPLVRGGFDAPTHPER